MRILLCGGGTAGHINPAIAIAEEMVKRYPSIEILFVGREGGRENEAVIKAGFSLKTLNIQGLKRSLSFSNISRIRNAAKALVKAKKILSDFKPDLILGTGGYVCWPIIRAGQRMKIPTAIHESNVFPGLTTRLLASKCNRVFLSRDETKYYLTKKAKTMTVGNPLRAGFASNSRGSARRSLGLRENEIFILSFGGSIGAERLNEVLIEVLEHHSACIPQIKHIHATGQRYFENISSQYKSQRDGCQIIPYIHNMPAALRAADIVICRCGAMTLSELMEVGVAAILIPSPNVSDNHQYMNAKYLSDKDAALLIEENDLTETRLTELILSLENDKKRRKNVAKNIKSLSTPNAAKFIVDELILIKK